MTIIFVLERFYMTLSVIIPRFDKKIRFYKKAEKPYFQFINLSNKITHLIFTLLPYCFPVETILNNKTFITIFKVRNLLITYLFAVV